MKIKQFLGEKSAYYDKQGNKIDMMTYVKLFENSSYKVIKQENAPSGKWISTVWLGFDHQFGEGTPLIFETMVFPDNNDMLDLDCERYSTLAEAEAGHKKMVEKYTN